MMKNESEGITPIRMIEGVAAEICENISLLETIYSHYELPPEAENAIACLIRSLYQTRDKANRYAEVLVSKSK